MDIILAAPIRHYFEAEKGDPSALLACFTESASVTDEGHRHTGHAAIRDWKEQTVTQYDYAGVIVDVEAEGDDIRVTRTLTGNFPGSPIDLIYHFTLSGDRIAALEIAP
jgi:hypothetical protein